MLCAGNRTVGSNPTLSAIIKSEVSDLKFEIKYAKSEITDLESS